MVWFQFPQDDKEHFALGQITEVELQNFMLEFSEMRSIARQRGSVNPISGLQDTHRGLMTTGAVFRHNGKTFEPSVLGTVPSTGTGVYKANNELLDKLLENYKNTVSYFGNFYLSDTKLPLAFTHFGKPNEGGAGEAYHIGIYGMTGSAKSTLSKMMIACYARHPTMAIFVFDPSGEFSMAARGQKGNEVFYLNLREIFTKLGKDIIICNLGDLVLDRWELFGEILYEAHFFQTFPIPKNDNRRLACDALVRELRSARVALENLTNETSFDQAMTILGDPQIQQEIYSSTQRVNQLSRAVQTQAQPANRTQLFQNDWIPITELFNPNGTNRITVGSIIDRTFNLQNANKRPIVIINLSREEAPEGMFWNDTIKAMIIKRVLNELTRRGLEAFNRGEFLNTLVVLDEAQKLVPREKFQNDEENEVRAKLISAVETTRKYGLGWMFISTSLSTLHREIYRQNRISFYGFGLSSGSELNELQQLISDPHSLKLYQSFQDPHSAFDVSSRTYSFMSRGPVSPLSFSGSPLFLTLFNQPEQFLNENKLK